jgi:hypothetical protein
MKERTWRKLTEILNVYPYLSSDKMVKYENTVWMQIIFTVSEI